MNACRQLQTMEVFSTENPKIRWFGGLLIHYGILFPLFITIPLITSLSVLHIVLVLWNDFHLSVTILQIVLLSGLLISLLRTTFREPGFIPRCKRAPNDPPPNSHNLSANINGKDWRWCDTCNLWRPPRSKHCYQLDACVNHFDHYCPWVGNAVGLRNFLSFYCFIFFLCMHCISVFTTVIISLVHYAPPDWVNGIQWTIVTFAGLAMLSGTAMLWANTQNLRKGVTTAESWRQRKGGEPGYWRNVKLFCNNPSQLVRTLLNQGADNV